MHCPLACNKYLQQPHGSHLSYGLVPCLLRMMKSNGSTINEMATLLLQKMLDCEHMQKHLIFLEASCTLWCSLKLLYIM